MKDRFRRISNSVSNIAGSAWMFCLAVLAVLIWAGSGPSFNYSDTWQLVINTGTTIVTFLMVFLIQNTQNRDAKAMQLKLDELLRATKARDTFIDIEALSDEELEELAAEFSRIQKADDDNPVLLRIQQKLQAALTKRRTLPGERVVTQAVNLLNPFSGPQSGKQTDQKPAKKPDLEK